MSTWGSPGSGKLGNLSFSLLDHLLLVPSRPSFWPRYDMSIENLDHGLSLLRDPLSMGPHGLSSKCLSLELWPFMNCPSHLSLHL